MAFRCSYSENINRIRAVTDQTIPNLQNQHELNHSKSSNRTQ